MKTKKFKQIISGCCAAAVMMSSAVVSVGAVEPTMANPTVANQPVVNPIEVFGSDFQIRADLLRTLPTDEDSLNGLKKPIDDGYILRTDRKETILECRKEKEITIIVINIITTNYDLQINKL